MAITLYVNGDSHTAAAEAVNPHGFAQDDSQYWRWGRVPHPDNLEVSWGRKLSKKMDAALECHAESASSNTRIKRTTIERLAQARVNGDWPDFIVIGWSTWERQEWLYDDIHWQVNAGGIGHDWPDEIKRRYKEYVANIDYDKCVRNAHREIYELHLDLRLLNIKHLFFNTFEPLVADPPVDWLGSYLEPYNRNFTFYNWCLAQGFETVYPGSYHFGPDAHAAWADFIYPYIVQTALTQ
jgi:hypothetical protein